MPIVVPTPASATSGPQSVVEQQVFDYIIDTAGKPVKGAIVNCVLTYAGAAALAPVVNIGPIQQTTTTDNNGYWTFNLVSNANLNPAGTVYTIQTAYNTYDISVPSTGGPFQSSSITTSTPATLSTATTGLVGPITVTGNETVTGNLAVGGTTNLTGAITSDATFNGNVFIHGPMPWVDARALGAKGDGATDDT